MLVFGVGQDSKLWMLANKREKLISLKTQFTGLHKSKQKSWKLMRK